MSRPPLHALQGFVAAARSGNLSRTAESLHLTVSALSHQIRGLEERVGTPLFVRKARGVALTADGEQLFQRIAPHLAAIEDALRPYRTRRDDMLTITLMPSFATSWLLPRLPRFVAAHPQIEINMQSGVGLVDFERDRSVDAGLRYGPGRWPGLTAVHLFDDWVAPVASPALIARLGQPTLKTLAEFPLLGAPGGRWSQWFEHFGGRTPRRFVATFDDSETLHRAAAEGLGIGLGRMSLLQPTIDAGRLLRLFDEQLPAEFAHYLVYPPRSSGHAGLAAFSAWVVDEAQRYVASEKTPAPADAGKRSRKVAARLTR
ncbi:MAG TPA: LysR substrate-binding domain-containing protein [Xanthomonadaceae bacterium]|nr:LysR substrate-binding domain-containing protein [Xanthomonadaceae bacterium]